MSEQTADQVQRWSNDTKRAISELADRSREGALDTELDLAADVLSEVERRIGAIVGKLPKNMGERAEGLELVAQQSGRVRDVLLSNVSLTIRDYSVSASSRPDKLEARFGNLLPPEEIRALKSQTEVTASSLSTASADSAMLANIDSYGKYLHDWWRIAVSPTADLVNRATTSTSQVTVGAIVSMPLSAVLEEERGRRAAEMSRELESALKDAKTATTAVGAGELTKAFDDVREQAVTGARLWTTAVFLCVLAGIAIPVLALKADWAVLTELEGLTGVVIKSLLGLPLFALAGYSGHIAAQHRETARHLTVLVAQIKSVQAYANELPSTHKLALMSKLGDRAFADPGFTLQERGIALIPEGTPQALSQIKTILEKLVGKT